MLSSFMWRPEKSTKLIRLVERQSFIKIKDSRQRFAAENSLRYSDFSGRFKKKVTAIACPPLAGPQSFLTAKNNPRLPLTP